MGPRGPGDINVEGDWEGPIELFEFEYEDEGWVCCTPGYYWHPVLGEGIYQHEDEWYRNWEFDYEPPEEEIVPEEPEDIEKENPKIPQDPSKEGTSGKQTPKCGRNSTDHTSTNICLTTQASTQTIMPTKTPKTSERSRSFNIHKNQVSTGDH